MTDEMQAQKERAEAIEALVGERLTHCESAHAHVDSDLKRDFVEVQVVPLFDGQEGILGEQMYHAAQALAASEHVTKGIIADLDYEQVSVIWPSSTGEGTDVLCLVANGQPVERSVERFALRSSSGTIAPVWSADQEPTEQGKGYARAIHFSDPWADAKIHGILDRYVNTEDVWLELLMSTIDHTAAIDDGSSRGLMIYRQDDWQRLDVNTVITDITRPWAEEHPVEYLRMLEGSERLHPVKWLDPRDHGYTLLASFSHGMYRGSRHDNAATIREDVEDHGLRVVFEVAHATPFETDYLAYARRIDEPQRRRKTTLIIKD